MKTCPECGELLGDSVETCFNCNYNFLEAEKLKENERITQLSKNPIFEYQTVIVNNLETREINQIEFQKVLETWSQKGWRLHSVFNNELGKTSSSIAVGFIGSNVNATIDQTVLIFERCIKAESN